MKNNPILHMFAEDFERREELRNTISDAENSKRKLEETLHQKITNELLAYTMSDTERIFLNHKVRGARIIETLLQYAMKDTAVSRKVLIDESVQRFLFSKLNQNRIRPIIGSLNKTFESVLKFNLYDRHLDAEFIKPKPSKEHF